MPNFNLKMKLALGSWVVLMLLILNSISNFYTTQRLLTATAQAERDLKGKEIALRIEIAVRKQARYANDFAFTGDSQAEDRYRKSKEDAVQGIGEARKLLGEGNEQAMLDRIEQSATTLAKQEDEIISLRRQQRTYEASNIAFSPKAEEAIKQLGQACAELEQEAETRAQGSRARAQEMKSSNFRISVILAVAAVLIGMMSSFLIARSISGNVDLMLAMLREIAGNNLAVRDLEITTGDEIGAAGTALNQMKNNLQRVIQSIVAAVEQVASASEQISSSATRQSAGSATQKDRTAQVATAMQQMSSSVLQVSENSNLAAEASRNAAETARQGGLIVEDTLGKMRSIASAVSGTAAKMEELGRSSDQIGRIAGVIDDIADQTNLLALNAAIEAARAGEQGRGFAVVADEVRKLAERTTTATTEIAGMIRTIQEETRSAVTAMEDGTRQVEDGVESTSRAGEALKKIIQTSEQVGEMITHIATAATEQSSASEEINLNMNEIAKLLQESSKDAQQSERACQDLSTLALDLNQTVGGFKLSDNPKLNGKRKTSFASQEPAASKPKKAFAASAGHST